MTSVRFFLAVIPSVGGRHGQAGKLRIGKKPQQHAEKGKDVLAKSRIRKRFATIVVHSAAAVTAGGAVLLAYFGCNPLNFTHYFFKFGSLLSLLLIVQRDFFTELSWIRHFSSIGILVLCALKMVFNKIVFVFLLGLVFQVPLRRVHD